MPAETPGGESTLGSVFLPNPSSGYLNPVNPAQASDIPEGEK